MFFLLQNYEKRTEHNMSTQPSLGQAGQALMACTVAEAL